jgi:HTH-type transcriptional regulator/antitoxin HigA
MSTGEFARKCTLAYHPGGYVRDEIEARGMTQRELAVLMGRPYQVINEIIQGRKAITAETALELVEISAQTWLNLQAAYELAVVRERRAVRTASASDGAA